MKSAATMVWVTVLATIFNPCRADAGGGEPHRKWTLSVCVGGVVGGPGGDLEDAMRLAAFDKHSPPGFFGPGRDHPFTGGAASFGLRLSRSFGDGFAVSGYYGRTDFGLTGGYHEQGEYLHVSKRVDVVALLISVEDASMMESFLTERLFEISAGIGPALYLVDVWQNDELARQDETKAGFVVDFSLRAPVDRMFFVAFEMQYRWLGRMDLGPYTATALLTGETATLPEVNAAMAHAMFGVSAGIRF